MSATCTSANINLTNYNAIKVGMTLAQVNQTLGCAFDPAFTQRNASFTYNAWIFNGNTTATIIVYFDASDSIVTALSGGTIFKTSQGF